MLQCASQRTEGKTAAADLVCNWSGIATLLPVRVCSAEQRLKPTKYPLFRENPLICNQPQPATCFLPLGPLSYHRSDYIEKCLLISAVLHLYTLLFAIN